MYDPTVGRWTSQDPSGFSGGDIDLYRYVRNSPTNGTDASGLADTNDDFERNYGIADAITNGTMTPADLNGRRITTPTNSHGQSLEFQFLRAYKGIYRIPPPNSNQDMQGVYVKIQIKSNGWDIDELRMIQITRTTTFTGPITNRMMITYRPPDPYHSGLAGWGREGTPHQGWYVDQLQRKINPYYDDPVNSRATSGDATHPAIFHDTPSLALTLNEQGADFYLCAIGIKNGKAQFLGCLHWGYYVNSNNDVSFDPANPEASLDAPPELAASMQRWNNTFGVSQLTIGGITSQPPPAAPAPHPQGGFWDGLVNAFGRMRGSRAAP
jgi:hypothetical protein